MSYLRFPHLVGDTVVFAADDDIWSVPAHGGAAARLTADRAPVSRPRLSPDGATVAWATRRDGNPEVYVVPVAGGAATRLTFWNSPQTRVLGWTGDGRVVAASPALQPFRSRSWAYALPVDGGPGQRLPYGPVSGIARRPGGATVLQSTLNREPATWKRYRGGTRGRFWLDADGSGTFERLLADLDGQLADPVWVGERLVFISDHEGHGNVYSVRIEGDRVDDLRRHSDHTGSYARDLSGDLEGGSSRLVYQRAGELYLLDSFDADAQPRPLGIALPGSRAGRLPQLVDPLTSLTSAEGVSVDRTARASVVDIRGTIQWLTTRDGPVRALAQTPGVRARLPRVLPGERRAVWVTDAEGDDALELTGDDGPRRLATGELGRVLELVPSPSGTVAAVAAHDGRVLLVGLADGSVRELDRSDSGDATGLAWSPDSRWLAWSTAHPQNLRSLRLAEVATGELADVTEERFVDTDPVFTTDGRYLAFLSARTFDPVYDVHNFELSFTTGVRPYVVPLAADTPSPFDPEPQGREPHGREPHGRGPDGPRETAPVSGGGAAEQDRAGSGEVRDVRVDVDGIGERAVVVPVPVGRHRDLRAADGGLLWLTDPVTGELGEGLPVGQPHPRPTLWRWDFAERRATAIVAELDWFAVSGDGSRILVRDGETLRVGPADRAVQPKADDPAAAEDLVTVDLDRVVVRVEPPAEWRQMTRETWRLMRDHFWIADMGGVDWDDVIERYLPVVDRVNTRDDLSEVLWEMVGELGASHAYERIQYAPAAAGRAAAFLGADLRRDDDGWVIEQVLPGESSVPAARSPLRSSGAAVEPGDRLVEVDGRPVPPAGPGPLLAGTAGKPVELTLERDGARRTVVVVPTEDETPIRYHAWVAGRREWTHGHSAGRIGYLHVPDMMSAGWAQFNRDLRRELRRDALLLDTRDNAGGHVSSLVLERLSRRPLGGDVVRHGAAEPYPPAAPRGPMLSLANEHAGSDGDIVNEGFRELGLGPVVGTRTWGGVIGIDSRYALVDGTVVTQPRYSFWFRDAGWTIENYGVEPDVDVPMPPQAWAAGDDPQLAAGLAMLDEALSGWTPLQPPGLETRPDRAAPPLPPRPAAR